MIQHMLGNNFSFCVGLCWGTTFYLMFMFFNMPLDFYQNHLLLTDVPHSLTVSASQQFAKHTWHGMEVYSSVCVTTAPSGGGTESSSAHHLSGFVGPFRRELGYPINKWQSVLNSEIFFKSVGKIFSEAEGYFIMYDLNFIVWVECYHIQPEVYGFFRNTRNVSS